jgi:hypothetical protein
MSCIQTTVGGNSPKLFMVKLSSSLRHNASDEKSENQSTSFDLDIPNQRNRSVVYKIDVSQDLLVTFDRWKLVI